MPNALARSLGSVNVVVSSDSAEGTSSAANAPWQARAVISMAKLTDAPPMAETTANPARPTRKVVLRPSRSASLPPTKQQAAECQGVGGDHPLPGHRGEAQRMLRRRQRDNHHRDVPD